MEEEEGGVATATDSVWWKFKCISSIVNQDSQIQLVKNLKKKYIGWTSAAEITSIDSEAEIRARDPKMEETARDSEARDPKMEEDEGIYIESLISIYWIKIYITNVTHQNKRFMLDEMFFFVFHQNLI